MVERTIIFIDGSNFYHGLKKNIGKGTEIDFGKFGDGDFVPAVKAVQEFGKRVENFYFKGEHSWHLRQTCDKSVLMDSNFISKCKKSH
jgi:hypothetical protein